MLAKRSVGSRVFDTINYVFLILLVILSLYPVYYVVIAAISNPQDVISGRVVFYPVNFTLESVYKVMEIDGIGTAFMNTFYYTVVGTLVSMGVTVLCAYPLSRKGFIGRRVINFILSFTMWFSAGMIPFYLNLDMLGLIDTRAGIILPFACSAFYVILVRNYFEGLPDSFEEAAKIDGAGDFTIFFKIMLPMATPVIATVGMFYAVERWNGYFWSMIILKSNDKIPLQILLKKLVVDMQVLEKMDVVTSNAYNKETLIYATIIISMAPIVMLYPFIQRFFVKGLTLGGVKG